MRCVVLFRIGLLNSCPFLLFWGRGGAVRELLLSKCGCDRSASTVVAFDRRLVSLPEGAQVRNRIQDLAAEEDRELVVNCRESILRDAKDVMQMRECGEGIAP
eukprot:9427909-Pyramimonas_sp.AAC.1